MIYNPLINGFNYYYNNLNINNENLNEIKYYPK